MILIFYFLKLALSWKSEDFRAQNVANLITENLLAGNYLQSFSKFGAGLRFITTDSLLQYS